MASIMQSEVSGRYHNIQNETWIVYLKGKKRKGEIWVDF